MCVIKILLSSHFCNEIIYSYIYKDACYLKKQMSYESDAASSPHNRRYLRHLPVFDFFNDEVSLFIFRKIFKN